MANYNLAHWIIEQRNKKFTDKQIKDYLLNYGYSEEAINDSFNFISSQGVKEMKMGNPPPAGGIRVGEDHYDLFAILAIVSIFFFPLLALPFGVISLKHIKHDTHLKGKSLSIIGIIFGSISLLFLILWMVFFVLAFTVRVS